MFGFLGVIWGCWSYVVSTSVGVVAVYIGGAYWFTVSTSFVNPVVMVARALMDSFVGIRSVDVAGRIVTGKQIGRAHV